MRGARCEPKPVQRPHPPLVIGGSGKRRRLRTAVRLAQHWNFDTGTAGADPAIVYLPVPYTPHVLEPLAVALVAGIG